jgi:hypothetical protein
VRSRQRSSTGWASGIRWVQKQHLQPARRISVGPHQRVRRHNGQCPPLQAHLLSALVVLENGDDSGFAESGLFHGSKIRCFSNFDRANLGEAYTLTWSPVTQATRSSCASPTRSVGRLNGYVCPVEAIDECSDAFVSPIEGRLYDSPTRPADVLPPSCSRAVQAGDGPGADDRPRSRRTKTVVSR